jgi:diaminopimelate dehydrogenase
MKNQTSIAIVGYGNIGRAVHRSIIANEGFYGDVKFGGIVTRDPSRVSEELWGSEMVYDAGQDSCRDLGIDVAILCGGSKKDLPIQGPLFSKYFNTVDSFDTHDHIGPYVDEKTHKQMPGYFAVMDAVSTRAGNVAAVSFGWDPGTFSLERVLGSSFIPGSHPRGFYGLSEQGGLSMGHSDAIRNIEGVADARQYTHAIPEAIEALRLNPDLELTPREMHWRECLVVLEDDNPEARARVKKKITTMPQYFADNKTTVEFVSQNEINGQHQGMPHDGVVITSGKTGEGNLASIEYGNTWQSNPEGTAGILVATARAVHRLSKEGKRGAHTILDIPPAYYSPHSQAELLKSFM